MPYPRAATSSLEEKQDREVNEIDVLSLTQEELRNLTADELRRCLNAAETSIKLSFGARRSIQQKKFNKLNAEFKRRNQGRTGVRWRSAPPPPRNPPKS